MILEFQKLKEKDQALLILLASRVPKQALHYLDFLPKTRAQRLQEPLEKFLKRSKKDSEAQLQQGLQDLKGQNTINLIDSAEAGWLVEAFAQESPEIIAQIIQWLPRDKIGGFLKDLPKETRKSLQQIQGNTVSSNVQKQIRKISEARFPAIAPHWYQKEALFKLFKELPLKQLQKILHELGISELAIAFSQVSRAAVRALLNRLNLEDAKELQKRIKEGAAASPAEQKEAQLKILSLELEKLKPHEIIEEIGFGVLSVAFCREDLDAATYLIYKFPPALGYIFRRYIDQQMESNLPEKAAKVRQKIEAAYERLKPTLNS